MKIIATIGPSSMDKKILCNLIKNGVKIVRLNFSHFYEDDFKQVISTVREFSDETLIMADLCGKKIRVYEGLKSTYRVYAGEEIYFCGQDLYKNLCTSSMAHKFIPLTLLSDEISKNKISNIYMKDGSMCFKVVEQKNGVVMAILEQDGIVRAGKGCNIPGLYRGNMELSEYDKKSINWAIENDVDIICQSYVESEREITDVKEYIDNYIKPSKEIKFYSKIESPTGVKNCRRIIEISDGIVIGRGDLVPECGVLKAVEEELKVLRRIKSCNYNKEVIIATHVLDSMKYGNRASLAEIESIYSFIKKGATGFMLASETSICKTSTSIVTYLKEILDCYSK